jgi:uncharacterized protein YkwD
LKRADRRLRGALLAFVCVLSSLTLPAAASAARDEFRSAMLNELNRVRARHHLPSVRTDGRLNGAAVGWSRSMVRAGGIGHGAWASRVIAAAGRGSSVGEVVGWLVHRDPRGEAVSMVRDWLHSPPHRHVMLSRGFRRVGIGRATGPMQGLSAAVYTVDFASAR